jgi:hypothetical protein
MKPYMTWDELKSKYPDCWVLLFNPQSPMLGYEVFGGEFVYKNKNREKVWSKANEVGRGHKLTIRFTGNVASAENTAILL